MFIQNMSYKRLQIHKLHIIECDTLSFLHEVSTKIFLPHVCFFIITLWSKSIQCNICFFGRFHKNFHEQEKSSSFANILEVSTSDVFRAHKTFLKKDNFHGRLKDTKKSLYFMHHSCNKLFSISYNFPPCKFSWK